MTQAQLATAIAQAVAAAIGQPGLNKPNRKKVGKGKKKASAKLTESEKADYMAQNDAACVKAFAEKGIQDVQPRVNVMTYNKWIEKGFKVRKGEKSTRVGPFALFHSSQVDEIESTADQVAA